MLLISRKSLYNIIERSSSLFSLDNNSYIFQRGRESDICNAYNYFDMKRITFLLQLNCTNEKEHKCWILVKISLEILFVSRNEKSVFHVLARREL